MAVVKVLDSTPEPASKKISTYLIISGSEAVIIDSGPKTGWSVLKPQVEAEGVTVKHVIVTHIHLDHAGAAATIARDIETLESIYVHPRGAKHIINPEKLWAASYQLLGSYAEYFGKPDNAPENLVKIPQDGEELNLLDNSTFKIIYTPGHASHHMSVYLVEESVMFTGDSAGVSLLDDSSTPIEFPTTPPPFKPSEYMASLEKMLRFKPSKIALGHYGFVDHGVEYLMRHSEDIKKWIKVAIEYVARGGSDFEELARLMSQHLDNARAASSASDPIISEFMYRGTIMGLLDMAIRGEGRDIIF